MIRCSTTVLSALVISVDFNMEAIDALDAFGGVGVDDVDLADAGVHHLWVDVLWAGETAEKLLIELEELGWGSADQHISNIATIT